MRLKYFYQLTLCFVLFFTASASAVPIAEYHLNEFFWDSSPKEVIDSSGNGYHGQVLVNTSPSTASPVTMGNPGTCGYASMAGGAIALTGLPVSTAAGAKTTVSFWMNWDGSSSVMPIGWQVYDLYFSSNSFGFNSGVGDIYGIPSTGLANGWHHVSAEFTNGNMYGNRLVIDGVEQRLTQRLSRPNNSRTYVGSELRVGGWIINGGYKFSGGIDEVRVHNGALSVAEVRAIMDESESCVTKEPIADWHFDELSWSGISQEVKDSSNNGHDGEASIGTTTTDEAQLCRAADLTADSIKDYVVLDNDALHGLNDFSVSLWATVPNSPSGLISAAGSSSNNELLIFKTSATKIRLYLHNESRQFTVPNLEDGLWHHFVWTRTGTNNCLYVDGSLTQCVSTYRAAKLLNVQGLVIGQEQDAVLARFDKGQEHEGLVDEVSIYNRAINAVEVAELHDNISAGKNADGTVRHCPGTPVAEWRFDEPFWNGATGEVIDSSANQLHGKSIANAITDATTPALAGRSGTCGYGVFDGTAGGKTGQHIQLPNDSNLNSISDALTLTAWVNVSESGPYNYIISNDRDCCGSYKGFSLSVRYGGNVPEFKIWDNAGSSHVVHGTRLNLSQWYHLSATFDGKEMKLYVDGVLAGTTYYTGKIGTDSSYDTVLAGLGHAPSTYNLTGLLDEVRVYDAALDETAILGVMNDTRACSDSCNISHDYLLFEDDFDDGDFSGWDIHRFNGKGCGWTVENGRLKEQRNSCSGFLGHGLKTSERILKDYVIKADIDARPAGGNNGVGLVFGYVDDKNYYIVRWRDYGTAYTSSSTHRNFELLKVSAGVTSVLDRQTQFVLPDSFEMTVDVTNKNGINVFIDCGISLQASEDFPEVQEFGLYTHDNDSAVYYDNVRVYGKVVQPPEPLALFHLDGSNWSGSANEIVDSSGNNHHGQVSANTSPTNASPVKNTDPGTCGYASQNRGSILIPNLPVSTTAGDKTTISFWMKWDGTNSVMPIGWERYDLWVYSGNIGFNTGAGDNFGTSTLGLDSGWHHLSAEFTNGNVKDNRIVIDGVEQTLSQLRNFPSNTYAVVGPDLHIGGWGVSGGYRFTGDIDELRVDNGSLSVEQVQTIMNQTHPCSGTTLDHFKISHDGAGIHCADETVIVSAIDGNGNYLESYTGTVTLDTQTSTGSWVSTSGYGVLNDSVADDGVATYTFSSADKGSVSLRLRYEEGPATFNIDAYDGGIRDDDSEDDFTYAASGFLLTANPISNPPPTSINDPILTQTSGADFPVYITAYGQSATHPECGVIENYTGNKPIRFQGDYINPTSGTRSISVNGDPIRMGGLDSSRIIKFLNGKAELTVNYKDAGNTRIRAYDTTEADNVYGISNAFVVKPDGFKFEVKRSSDDAPNPAAANASGDDFVAAGAGFDVKVSAVDVNGDTTPNYGNESTPESVKISHALVAPIGGAVGSMDIVDSLISKGNGVFSGTYSWDEVGIIKLTGSVLDDNYLGAGNIISDSDNIGRFIPEHFAINNKQDGNLSKNCTVLPGVSGFNYMGQEFGYSLGNRPTFDIEAKNLAGVTTDNYEGGFAKLSIAGVSIATVNKDASNGMPITPDEGTASLAAFSKGIATYTFGEDKFTYARSTAIGKFNSDIDLLIESIKDSDDVKDNFSTTEKLEPSEVELRYGRLMINSAFGSELLDLILPISLQVYDDATGGFRTDTDSTDNHSCAVFTVSPLEMLDGLDPSLVSTSLSPLTSGGEAAFTNGEAALTITAPGAGNRGTLGVTLDAPSWLQFDWGRPLTEPNRLDPKATATFGIDAGNDAFIYQREVR